MLDDEPPPNMVSLAELAASQSPCVKSKRGAVVWGAYPGGRNEILCAAWNGPPEPFVCNKNEQCAERCNKRCLHAESRALRSAMIALPAVKPTIPLAQVYMLHVKIELEKGLPSSGKVVPGGPPSCWQCSREILDMGLAGIWLYRRPDLGSPGGATKGIWRFYNALEFHVSTLKHEGLFDRGDGAAVGEEVDLMKTTKGNDQ